MINIPYILAHFIGDFLFQNDWMAVNKKKSNWVCTVHVFLYMLPFLLVELNWFQFLLIAVQHWLQDRTKFVGWWCRTMGSFQTELKHNALIGNNQYSLILPWGHFVVDQIFHFIWLWIVFNYFG